MSTLGPDGRVRGTGRNHAAVDSRNAEWLAANKAAADAGLGANFYGEITSHARGEGDIQGFEPKEQVTYNGKDYFVPGVGADVLNSRGIPFITGPGDKILVDAADPKFRALQQEYIQNNAAGNTFSTFAPLLAAVGMFAGPVATSMGMYGAGAASTMGEMGTGAGAGTGDLGWAANLTDAAGGSLGAPELAGSAYAGLGEAGAGSLLTQAGTTAAEQLVKQGLTQAPAPVTELGQMASAADIARIGAGGAISPIMQLLQELSKGNLSGVPWGNLIGSALGIGSGVYGMGLASDLSGATREDTSSALSGLSGLGINYTGTSAAGTAAASAADPWGASGGRDLATQQLISLMGDPSQLMNDPGYKARMMGVARTYAPYGQNSGNMAVAAANASGDYYQQRLASLGNLQNLGNPVGAQQVGLQTNQTLLDAQKALATLGVQKGQLGLDAARINEAAQVGSNTLASQSLGSIGFGVNSALGGTSTANTIPAWLTAYLSGNGMQNVSTPKSPGTYYAS